MPSTHLSAKNWVLGALALCRKNENHRFLPHTFSLKKDAPTSQRSVSVLKNGSPTAPQELQDPNRLLTRATHLHTHTPLLSVSVSLCVCVCVCLCQVCVSREWTQSSDRPSSPTSLVSSLVYTFQLSVYCGMYI